MKIINLGILAHVDAGKTTVTEALLHASGALRSAGRVDYGNTTTDSLAIERARGITVRAATVSFEWLGTKVNILDTPGHVDFIAEVERSLMVLDAAVLVVSAREGVQSQTKALMDALNRLRIPTLVFINKLDRAGADCAAVLGQIARQSGRPLLLRQRVEGVAVRTMPLSEGEGAIEALFELDEAVAEEYLASGRVALPHLESAFRKAVARGAILPVYAGAALSELGIPELMEAICAELPAAPEGGQSLSALVYKVEQHPRLGQLAYCRVYGGALTARTRVERPDGDPFRLTLLFTPKEGELRGAGTVPAGDIAAIPTYGFLRVGSALGSVPPPVRLAGIAKPLLLAKVSAGVPRDALLGALKQLAVEDPLLDLSANAQTGALEVRVFGPVQMEILASLARERFGFEVEFSRPQTIFREYPLRRGIGDVGWGDTPYAAAMGISIAPLPEGAGIQYETKVDYGVLTASFQNAVQGGLLASTRYGIYGWELTDAAIALEWAEYSSVLSTPADYRNACVLAVIRALKAAGTGLLEPLLHYTLAVPVDEAGRAAYDLGTMRATMAHGEARDGTMTFSGIIPLDASKEYAQAVAAYSKGRGVFSVRPAGHAPFAGDPAEHVNQGHQLPSEEMFLLKKSGRMG